MAPKTTLDERIRFWRKRRDNRRKALKRSRAHKREAIADRREIRGLLKKARRQRDNARLVVAHAETEADRRAARRELEAYAAAVDRLLVEILEANREVDEVREAFKRRQARLARAVKRVRHLEHKAAGQRGRVISRAEWGAADPRGGYAPQIKLKAYVQHHTAGPTLSPDATVEQEAAEMRAIQRQHQAQGWTDIGYGEVTFPSGRRYAGRPASAVGAGALGYNTGYGHGAIAGNFEIHEPTAAAIKSAHRTRTETFRAGDVPVLGHRDVNATACPGRNLYPATNDGRI
jgi:hypothetical protein